MPGIKQSRRPVVSEWVSEWEGGGHVRYGVNGIIQMHREWRVDGRSIGILEMNEWTTDCKMQYPVFGIFFSAVMKRKRYFVKQRNETHQRDKWLKCVAGRWPMAEPEMVVQLECWIDVRYWTGHWNELVCDLLRCRYTNHVDGDFRYGRGEPILLNVKSDY